MPTRVRLIDPREIDTNIPDTSPASYPWKFLAEGDSWFSFGSADLGNMLVPLSLRQESLVVSVAFPGDTLAKMTWFEKNWFLTNLTTHRYGYAWDALLVSGGGNDMIDAAEDLLQNSQGTDPNSYLVATAVNSVLDSIEASHRALARLRDRPASPCKGVPIITHTYDYPTPRNAPAFGVRGPWLYKALTSKGIAKSMWNAIAVQIIDSLADRLISLTQRIPNFHVADTRGTLVGATPGTTGMSNDWANEIHPTDGGYKLLAKKLSKKIDATL
jgi:lysophospholipase L1-like esterase